VLHHDHICKKEDLSTISGVSISDNNSGINDANVSIGAAGRLLNLLQTSTRRDIGREKQHQEEKKKTMDGRKENALRALTYSRVTAGVVVGHNIWNLNNTDFHALMEEKNSKKVEQVDKSISKSMIVM
jgi:hypothetical protein